MLLSGFGGEVSTTASSVDQAEVARVPKVCRKDLGFSVANCLLRDVVDILFCSTWCVVD